MPAILILLGQIIFGFFFGFLGLMLAVPLSACVAVLVDEMYVKDVLGDHVKSKSDVANQAEAQWRKNWRQNRPSGQVLLGYSIQFAGLLY